MRDRIGKLLLTLCLAALLPGPAAGPAAAQASRQYVNPTTMPPDNRTPTEDEIRRLGQLQQQANSLAAQSNYDAAAKALSDAVGILSKTSGPRHPRTSMAMSNQAVALMQAGKNVEAEAIQRRVLDIRAERLPGDHPLKANITSDLAMALERQGRLIEAEGYAREALQMRLRMFGENNAETADSYNNLAAVLKTDGRLHESLALLARADAIYAATSPSAPGRSDAHANLVDVLYQTGRLDEALPLARAALADSIRKLGAGHARTAQAQSSLGLILHAIALEAEERGGQSSAAAAEASQLLQSASATFARTLGLESELRIMAGYNLTMSQLSSGGTVTQAWLDKQKGLVASSAKTFGRDHSTTRDINLQYAMLLLSAGKPAEARRAATDAMALIDRQQVNAAFPRFGVLNRFSSYAPDRAAHLVMRALWTEGGTKSRKNLEEAFVAAQSIGSRLGLSVALSAQRNPKEVARLQEAERQAQAADRAFFEARAGGDHAAALQRRLDAIDAVDGARKALVRSAPQLLSQPIPLARLQTSSGPDAALLRESEALIFLHGGTVSASAGQRRGFIFVVTKTRAAWAELPFEPGYLAKMIEILRKDLDSPEAARGFQVRGTQARPTFNRAAAHELYNALFAAPEIADILKDKEDWLIVPKGTFLSLPFAALVVSPPQGGVTNDSDPAALRATKWLGVSKNLGILPDVSMLAVKRVNRPVSPGARMAFFGVGDPEFAGPADPSGVGSIRLDRRAADIDITSAIRRLPRLPASSAEVKAMSAALGAAQSSLLLGAEASEAGLIAARDQYAHSDVILFATHGLVSDETPAGLYEPGLALTPPKSAPVSSNPNLLLREDGILTASEIVFMPISARWVILSACNTAAGSGTPEGLSGLTLAFLAAGADAVLATQWSIRDAVATDLTTRTVKFVAGGASKPKALRQAMASVLADTSQDESLSLAHPGAWAAFVQVGAD